MKDFLRSLWVSQDCLCLCSLHTCHSSRWKAYLQSEGLNNSLSLRQCSCFSCQINHRLILCSHSSDKWNVCVVFHSSTVLNIKHNYLKNNFMYFFQALRSFVKVNKGPHFSKYRSLILASNAALFQTRSVKKSSTSGFHQDAFREDNCKSTLQAGNYTEE